MDIWADLEFKLSDDFFQKCGTYVQVLLKYNKTHNITAFKSKDEILFNIHDSIYPLNFLEKKPKSIADIGSGAGFPGLFIALVLPESKVSLYEPLKKKSAFLHLAKSALKLKNVEIKSIRVEQEKQQKYDLIVSRAVTKTQLLLDISKNICSQDSSYLLYKGSRAKEELDEQIKAKIHTVGDRRYVFIKEKQ